VYIRNIGSDVTEDNLLAVFAACGSIQESRMCGDPNSSFRFAFIEFEAENSVAKVFFCACYSRVWRDASQSERLQMADSC
jgi:RNA recognition motif-containing protein